MLKDYAKCYDVTSHVAGALSTATFAVGERQRQRSSRHRGDENARFNATLQSECL